MCGVGIYDSTGNLDFCLRARFEPKARTADEEL